MIDFEDIEIGYLMYHEPYGVDHSMILARVIRKRDRSGRPNLIVKVLDAKNYPSVSYDIDYTEGYEFNYDYNSKFGQHCVYGKNKDELLIELI